MARATKIEWTQSDDGTPGMTFNPWWGCQKVSPGCTLCYAETLANRYGHDVWGPSKTTPRRMMSENYWKQPIKWNEAARKAGTRPRVFCASMSDWLEDHPMLIEPRARLIQLIHDTPHLDWLLLTKRPEGWSDRLHEVVWQTHDGADMLASQWLDGDAPPNVWAGTSVEDQERVGRVRALLEIPAAIHFLSVEPLIAPIDYLWCDWCGMWGSHDCYDADDSIPGIDWVIIGGESGHGARPMEERWVRNLISHCRDAGVAVFVKQMGAVWARDTQVAGKPVAAWGDVKGHDMQYWPADLRIREFPAVREAVTR